MFARTRLLWYHDWLTIFLIFRALWNTRFEMKIVYAQIKFEMEKNFNKQNTSGNVWWGNKFQVSFRQMQERLWQEWHWIKKIISIWSIFLWFLWLQFRVQPVDTLVVHHQSSLKVKFSTLSNIYLQRCSFPKKNTFCLNDACLKMTFWAADVFFLWILLIKHQKAFLKHVRLFCKVLMYD